MDILENEFFPGIITLAFFVTVFAAAFLQDTRRMRRPSVPARRKQESAPAESARRPYKTERA